MQQLPAGGGAVVPAPTVPGAGGPDAIDGELVPTLNGYMRSRVFREPMSYADCIRALADAARLVAEAPPNERDEARLEARAAAARVLPRLALFGALPPSSLPTLVAARRFLDNPAARPASVDRKLLRLAGYLLQLAAGEGSAGTPAPFSPLVGGAQPLRAVDVYEPSALDAVWAQVRSEEEGGGVAGSSNTNDNNNTSNNNNSAAAAAAAAARVAPHQRAAAFRALAALSRSSLVADAAAGAGGGDITLVSHLMAAAATTLDRADAARRRHNSLPPRTGLSALAGRDAERLAVLERTAAARVALCASRVGLPRAVLASKMAPRAFGLVNSPDALCARHALAVAAAAVRENPAAYAEALGPLLEANVQQFRSTGSLAGLADPAAAVALEAARQDLAEAVAAAVAEAKETDAAGDGGGGVGARGAGGSSSSRAALPPLPSAPSRPIRPSKDALLKGEARCVNALDAWARVYLARGCGAVVHALGFGGGGGGGGGGGYGRGGGGGFGGGGGLGSSSGGGGGPFWDCLTILACCDRSNIVAMEAIRALSGAGLPRAADALRPAGGKRAAPAVDEQREREDAAAGAAAWQLLLARAEDAPPGWGVPTLGASTTAAADVAAQFAAARLARGLPETPALARLCADPEEEEERQRQGLMALVHRRQQQQQQQEGGVGVGGGGSKSGGAPEAAAAATGGGPLSPAAAAALAFVAERQQQQGQQQGQRRPQSGGGATPSLLDPSLAAVLPELPPPAGPLTLLGAIAQRLLAALAPGASQASMCSASRAVAALAEARARAAAGARSREERESLLGGPTVRAILGALEDRMLAIARGDAVGGGHHAAASSLASTGGASGAAAPPAAHLRQLALSALLWFQLLPAPSPSASDGAAAAPPARLPPARVTEWLGSGGGSVPAAVRGIFADPWPEDCVAAFVHQLHRRLVAAPPAAPYLLACASAAAAAAPSRVKHDQLHAMWDFCLRQGAGGGGAGEGAAAAVRAALARLSAPLPAVAQPPSAAAPEVKAFAAREEVGHWALARSAAWWLGENANFACGEFAWLPRRVPEELSDALAEWGGGGGGGAEKKSKKTKKKKRGRDAGGSCSSSSSSSSDDDDLGRSGQRRRSAPNRRRQSAAVLPAGGQELLASAAASTNPMLTVAIAHLQRALIAGSWEVRVAAAQALAKVAVRSGEPFRVQCYALLSGAAPAARAGLAAPGAGAAAAPASGKARDARKPPRPQQQQQQQQQQQLDAGIAAPAPSLQQQQRHHRGADPLGVAAAVAPALEVLDALYSAEVVVEALARQYGRRRRGWPRSALAALERRNRALLAAVLERVCFVPQDSYWPLGALARDVLKGRWDDEESTDEEEERMPEEWGGGGGGGEGEEEDGAAGGGGGSGGEVIIATGEGVEEQLEAERQRLAGLELEKKRKEEEDDKAAAAAAAATAAAAAAEEEGGGAYADSDDSDAPLAAAQRAAAADRLAGQLQGYDYDPNAAAFDEADAALQQQQQQRAAGAASSSSRPALLRGTALYDFTPEDDDEVAVAEGEALRVEWEQGGWMQVVRESDGVAGIVPSSYVRLEEGGGGGGGAGGGVGGDDDDDDLLIGDDDDSDVAAARLGRAAVGAARRVSQEYLQRRGSGGAGSYGSPHAGGGGGGFALRRATAATTAGGAAAAYGYSTAAAADAEEDRLGEREDREAGAVDVAMAVGRLGNESAELGRAEGRLEELERGGGGGGAANLPQLMALHEAIEAAVARMDALQGPLGSDGRAMRRRLRARGLEMLARVEALRAGGGGGGGGGAASPLAGVTPRGSGSVAGGGGYFGDAGASPRAEAQAAAAGGGGGSAVVAFAFAAEADGELTVASGDRVAVEAEVDGWYSVVRESDGARGLVPASYVELG